MFKNLLSEITINRNVLRQFGWVMAVMLGLIVPVIITWFQDWELVRTAIIVSLAGVLFLLAGLTAPQMLRYPYIIWMLIALVLGTIVTRIIITVVFYLMITPVGFIRRHFGTKDLLGLKPDAEKATYWVIRDDDPRPDRMKKQY